MAEVTTKPRKVEVTLTMSEEEALYVLGALYYANPVEYDALGGDPVYFALFDALKNGGIDMDVFKAADYAERREDLV